jgi:WXG100 family type VII secretion target
MSAEVIQAKYDALEAIAQKFGQESEVNSEMYGRIQQAVHSLEQGGWEGQGASAFFAEMNQTINPTLQRLINALEQAQTVTLQISNILQVAEEEAAAPFREDGTQGIAAGFAGISGNAFAGANISGATANIGAGAGGSVWGGIKDFFGGAYAEGKDMVSGVWNMVRHPVDTAKGLWHGITHPGELWDAIKKPYVDDWNNGHPWRAIGRGTMALVTTVLGTKGADKIAKAAKGATIVDDVARAGTLADDAARAGSVADDVGRAGGISDDVGRTGRVVDDVAGGARSVDDLVARYGDNGARIVREYGDSVGGDILRTFDDISDVTGSGQLMDDLLSASGSTRQGALSELGHAAGLRRRGVELESVGNMVNGRRGADILTRDGRAIDVKDFNWSSGYYNNPTNVQRAAEKMARQARRFQDMYPGRQIEYAFTDLANTPRAVIDALEGAGARVTGVVWPN